MIRNILCLRQTVAATAAILAAACSDSGSPHSVSGATVSFDVQSITDTIDAPMPVVITVRDGSGNPVSNTNVKVETVTVPVTPGGSPQVARTFTIPTNAAGQASLNYAGDWIAGRYFLRATEMSSSVVDSIPLTVEPGNAEIVAVFPRDSALYVGKSYVFRAVSRDRRLNIRSDVPVFTAGTAGVISVAGSTATGVGFGRTVVVAQVGAATDSVFVSTVPVGTIVGAPVGRGNTPFHIVDLDGSNHSSFTIDSVAQTDTRQLYLSSAGDRIVFHDEFGSLMRIFSVGLDGKGLLQLRPSVAGTQESQPQSSRDGAWVFYTAYDQTSDFGVWRATSAGGSPTRITPAGKKELTPTPSPDGSQVASLAEINASLTLQVRTLSTGVVDSTGLLASAPRWSPATSEIAFTSGDLLRVYDVSTHTTTTLTTPYRQYLYPHIDWSPDGAWLLTCAYVGTTLPGGLPPAQLVLVRRSPLLAIPLMWSQTWNLCEAAWKP